MPPPSPKPTRKAIDLDIQRGENEPPFSPRWPPFSLVGSFHFDMGRERMNRLYWSWIVVGGAVLVVWASACSSPREPAAALSDPVDIPLQPPPEWCALPSALDNFETCRSYARCCDHTLSALPDTCSFARTGSGAECSCALNGGAEVRCKESSGVTCECKPSR